MQSSCGPRNPFSKVACWIESAEMGLSALELMLSSWRGACTHGFACAGMGHVRVPGREGKPVGMC